MPVIAIDLGGTKLASAVFDLNGRIIHSEHIYLNDSEGEGVANLIYESCESLIRIAKMDGQQIKSIGICVPGIYYANSGKVWAPNIPGWESFPLLDYLKEKFPGTNIKVDSDRSCYILGETWQGNTKGCKDAIYLAVGTGIGAGIMIDGNVLRGSHDIGGAIGWMALDDQFLEKYESCGCFEYNASGEGIRKNVVERIQNPLFSSSHFANTNADNINTRMTFDAYENNDPLAVDVINNTIQYWGKASANLVSLFNPEKIIFGGGVFGPAKKFLDTIYEEAKKWAQPISITQVKFEASALDDKAGLYGAAFLGIGD